MVCLVAVFVCLADRGSSAARFSRGPTVRQVGWSEKNEDGVVGDATGADRYFGDDLRSAGIGKTWIVSR